MAVVPVYVLAGQSNASMPGIDNRLHELLSAQGGAFELVKLAAGKASLTAGAGPDWDPASGEMLTTLTDAVKAAIRNVEAQGHKAEVVTLWVHGEYHRSPSAAPLYGDQLTEFIAAYRAELGLGALPFQIAMLSNHAVIRDGQKAAARASENVSLIDTQGLTLWDGIHYDNYGREWIAEASFAAAGLVPEPIHGYRNLLAPVSITEGSPHDIVVAPEFADFIYTHGDRPVWIRSDSGDDRITTGAGDDFVNTGGNEDVIRAGGGDDRLVGGNHDDALHGEAGNDLLFGGPATDFIDGGEGIDTISYSDAAAGVSVRLHVTRAQQTGVAGLDTVRNVENIIGSRHGDSLEGSSIANRLDGLAGNDSLRGHSGDDVLLAGAGDDLLFGGHGSDRLDGGDGHDRLYGDILRDIVVGGAGDDHLDGGEGTDALQGGDGNDRLSGGSEHDALTGGAGGDTFLFDDDHSAATRPAADRIADFTRADGDLINLRGIDAMSATPDADDDFSFIGTQVFSGNGIGGELRAVSARGDTFIEGDVDGNGVADFVIRLAGVHALQATDFVL